MRHFIQSSLLGLLVSMGCSADQGSFRNSLTGEECEPNDTYVPSDNGKKGDHGNGGQNSPTGIPGDNMDDEHSGKIDCLGDGDSGQGNDDKNCIPAGCDDLGCCEDDVGDPDDGQGGDDSGEPDDGSGEPDDGGGEPDDGGGEPDDGGGEPDDGGGDGGGEPNDGGHGDPGGGNYGDPSDGEVYEGDDTGTPIE